MTALYSLHVRRTPLLLLLLWLCFVSGAWAQRAGLEISGQIVDNKGSGLPGVTIQVQGTTVGTSTDPNGKYSLQVPANATALVISSVGLVAQTVNIDGRKQINVTLREDAQALSEVVVVGYGTQKKSQTTGAISSVTSKEIAELPVTNARQALQGRAAGVDVIQSGSEPGGGVTVRIRGRRSINASNDPLYVVDGIPVAGGIDDINPQDIASLEVLKDASATGIYGSRGANGVVLVELGGEIRVRGRKQPGGELMRIGIERPDSSGWPLPGMQQVIELSAGGVTTSGNYRKFKQQGATTRAHLIDPKSGYPFQNEMISVTVVAPDALTADAYDNALMGMGLPRALAFLQAHPELQAYLIYQRPNGVVADTASQQFYRYLSHP